VVGRRVDVGVELFELPGVRSSPFTITDQPDDQNLSPGDSLTLTVGATVPTGTAFQWRRNGLAIPGATKLTYKVSKVTEVHEGRYDLFIRTNDYQALSQAATVSVADPAKVLITQHPTELLRVTGESATFTVGFASSSTAQVEWFKGSTVIPGASSASLTVNAISLADAGLYQAKITNSSGSVFSKSAQLAVVDGSNRFIPGKLNGRTTVKLNYAGTNLKFLWSNRFSALDASNGFGGVTSHTLTINKLTTLNQDDYRCRVMLGSHALVSGAHEVRIASIPVVTAASVLPSWIISQNVNLPVASLLNQTNLAGTPWNAATIFKITGLPKGLTYDPVTRSIVGRPTAGGGGGVTLEILASNVAGAAVAEITVTINIANFPPAILGMFTGVSSRNISVNNNLANSVQLTVTPIGTISGKVMEGKAAYSFTGALDTLPTGSDSTASLAVKRRGKPTLTLNLTLNNATGLVTSGELTEGAASAGVVLHRTNWSASSQASSFVGPYTATFRTFAEAGDPAFPQGDITLTATITSLGVMNGVTRFHDGTKTTFARVIANTGVHSYYVSAWNDTGSLADDNATLDSATGYIDGAASFFKAEQPSNSTTRSYKSGFADHSRVLEGGRWVKPTSTTLLLDVTDSGAANAPTNATIAFTNARINESVLSTLGTYLEQFRIKAPGSTPVVPEGVDNPGQLTLRFNANTGEFSGTFKTLDVNVVTGKPFTRTAPFTGVFLQRLHEERGFFNLARIPEISPGETNPAKTALLSGLVRILPDP
jgi:hypothetical protein